MNILFYALQCIVIFLCKSVRTFFFFFSNLLELTCSYGMTFWICHVLSRCLWCKNHYEDLFYNKIFNSNCLELLIVLGLIDHTEGKLAPVWEGPYRVVKCHIQGTYHLQAVNDRHLPRPWNAEHLKRYYP